MFWGIISLAVVSCAWDNAEELYGKAECLPGSVSFSQTVKPIIKSNCAVNGCHVNGQQRPTLELYDQIGAQADRILERTSNGTMPPSSSGKSLTQFEINAIACWVNDGALDN